MSRSPAVPVCTSGEAMRGSKQGSKASGTSATHLLHWFQQTGVFLRSTKASASPTLEEDPCRVPSYHVDPLLLAFLLVGGGRAGKRLSLGLPCMCAGHVYTSTSVYAGKHRAGVSRNAATPLPILPRTSTPREPSRAATASRRRRMTATKTLYPLVILAFLSLLPRLPPSLFFVRSSAFWNVDGSSRGLYGIPSERREVCVVSGSEDVYESWRCCCFETSWVLRGLKV